MPKPKQTRCSKTRGKKSEVHLNPSDPPRRRANKRRGHGNYANDRPPIVGTIGRESGQVRLRMVHQTDRQTLEAHVHQFTKVSAQVYTDEWRGYHQIRRSHTSVCHGQKEWPKMLMETGLTKSTPTPLKVCGQLSATFCVPFVGFTRNI